jgi:hypothetical protein
MPKDWLWGGVYVTIFYHLLSWVRHLKVVDLVMDSSTKWNIKKEKQDIATICKKFGAKD